MKIGSFMTEEDYKNHVEIVSQEITSLLRSMDADGSIDLHDMVIRVQAHLSSLSSEQTANALLLTFESIWDDVCKKLRAGDEDVSSD